MRILLINPPTTHIKGSGKPTLNVPLGILSIAGVLEKEGYNVQIYDTKINFNIRKRGKCIYFGDNPKTIEKNIKRIKPDIVGISNPFTVYKKHAEDVAKIIKGVNKKIPVIVGGPHTSVAPLDFLKNKNINYVVLGEGEYTFLKLVRYIEGKGKIENIKNIGYKKRGKVKITPRGEFIKELNKIPFPAYHLVDMEKYFKGLFVPRSEYVNRAISMSSSRGCPYNCVFCSIHLHMGRMWRAHSAKYVIEHIKYLVDKYNINLIHFEDDNFTLDKKRFERILDGIIKERIKIGWDTPNGVRADTLDKKLLKKVKKSGCQYLIIGVESGNQRVLNEVIGKQLDLKKVVEVAKDCKEIGLDLNAFFVIGLPGETLDDIKDTFEFAKMLNEKYDVYPGFHVAIPLLNTRLYEICKKQGYLTKEVTPENLLTVYTGRGIIKTPEFSPKDIESVLKEYKGFITKARIKRAIKHPYLIKSYLIKRISGTRLINILTKK